MEGAPPRLLYQSYFYIDTALANTADAFRNFVKGDMVGDVMIQRIGEDVWHIYNDPDYGNDFLNLERWETQEIITTNGKHTKTSYLTSVAEEGKADPIKIDLYFIRTETP